MTTRFPRVLLLLILLSAPAWLCAAEPAPATTELPKGVTSAPFEIQSERLFIKAALNDETTCSCLIDTGSDATLINRARVTVKALRSGDLENLQGAFVGGIQSQPATLKKLVLGTQTLQNCGVGIINHGKGKQLEQIDMLLGMDLLGRSRFTVDFKNSRILFWPPGSTLPKPPPGVERVQLAAQRGFKEEGTRPRVMGKLNGKLPAEFLIDFGADTPLYVATRDFKEIGFAPAGEPAGQLGVLTPSPMTLFFYRQPWPKLEFGSMAFENIDGRVMAAAQAPAAVRNDLQAMYNIIGTPFLKTLDAVHIDMPAKTIWFDRAVQPKK